MPKAEQYEMAMDMFGVDIFTSQTEIDHIYRLKALGCHPDKQGNQDEWYALQRAKDLIYDIRRF